MIIDQIKMKNVEKYIEIALMINNLKIQRNSKKLLALLTKIEL